jgi:hypothetical protein
MKKNIVILMLAGFLVSCVTINIYFPAAAAQEVADQIIDDVWQIKEGGETKDSVAKDAETTDATKTETPEAQ